MSPEFLTDPPRAASPSSPVPPPDDRGDDEVDNNAFEHREHLSGILLYCLCGSHLFTCSKVKMGKVGEIFMTDQKIVRLPAETTCFTFVVSLIE